MAARIIRSESSDALAPLRERVVMPTKFGCGINPDGTRYGVNTRPEHIRQVVDAMLTRLKVATHRCVVSAPRGPECPHRGRRRHREGTDSARQGEALRVVRGERPNDPPRTRRPARHGRSEGVLIVDAHVEHNGPPATCEQLGIGFVPFSPLGAGFLTRKIAERKHATPAQIALA